MELDLDPIGAEIQNALKTKTGQSTVPNIFINGQHIGGNSDLQALNESGELLNKVNAVKSSEPIDETPTESVEDHDLQDEKLLDEAALIAEELFTPE